MAFMYSVGQTMKVLLLMIAVTGSYAYLPPYVALTLCLGTSVFLAVLEYDDFNAEYCSVVRGTILIILGGVSVPLFFTPYTTNILSPEWSLFWICSTLGVAIIFFVELLAYRPWAKMPPLSK